MIREKRRGVRINARVPVTIQWQLPDGTQIHREAVTRVIGPHGCLAIVPEPISVGQQLDILNIVTQLHNQGVAVWEGHKRLEGHETGIELTEPPKDFWGLEL